MELHKDIQQFTSHSQSLYSNSRIPIPIPISIHHSHNHYKLQTTTQLRTKKQYPSSEPRSALNASDLFHNVFQSLIVAAGKGPTRQPNKYKNNVDELTPLNPACGLQLGLHFTS